MILSGVTLNLQKDTVVRILIPDANRIFSGDRPTGF
jgi:hypothetical protein